MSNWTPTRYGGLRRPQQPEVAQPGSAARRLRAGRTVQILPSGPLPITLAWAEPLGIPECPYVMRWSIETPVGSVRVHHWLGPDDVRAPHDHPWWFVTLVLRGGYWDRTPSTGPTEGGEHLRAPAVRFRSATHRHVVVPDPGGAWTLLATGRKVRPWGFWDGARFIKANKWFASRGHHPCANDLGANDGS